jgi:F-type H+-transporting ATPase subunit epsilon
MAKLSVDVVTGERVVLQEEDVDLVLAPSAEGQLGILPNHAALLTLLSTGEMLIRKGGNEQWVAVFGGFMEVLDNKVVVLADTAERAEEIDLARAEEARRRAEEALREAGERRSLAEAEAALRRSLVRLRIGHRSGVRRVPPMPGERQSYES